MGAAEKRESDRLLGPPEVAERLDISEESARRLIKRLKHVRIGLGRRQLLKLSERELTKFIESGGDNAWQDSIDEDESGGLRELTDSEKFGKRARAKRTRAQPSSSRPGLSKTTLLTPIVPRTKPVHSK